MQDFFENNKEDYEAYHLFPVRYQISSNEDIVDLLKYDILVELLKKHPGIFESTEAGGIKDSFKLFAVFCKEKGFLRQLLKTGIETSSGMLSLVPDPLFQVLGKLGRPLQDLLTIEEGFQVFKKKYLSEEKAAIDEFIEKIMVQSNGVATDHISWILSEKIKELTGDKKSVLILDDFERIDPEHIFRILNILSAHMEGYEDNKFGFDHIIIVGDINNIKSIFHHKYGKDTEFQGYFDKFFSFRPFLYDNKVAVREALSIILQRAQYEPSQLKRVIEGDSGWMNVFLTDILAQVLEVDSLNLRQLLSLIRNKFSSLSEGFVFRACDYDGPFDRKGNFYYLHLSIRILIEMFGKDDLLNILQRIRGNTSSKEKIFEGGFSEHILGLLSYSPNHPAAKAWQEQRSSSTEEQEDVDIRQLHEIVCSALIECVQVSEI